MSDDVNMCLWCPALSPFDLAMEKQNMCSKGDINIKGKENRSLWFRLKRSLLDHVSALASSSNACFLFGLFPGWILNHSGVVCKCCGAPKLGWFSHLRAKETWSTCLCSRGSQTSKSQDIELIAGPVRVRLLLQNSEQPVWQQPRTEQGKSWS